MTRPRHVSARRSLLVAMALLAVAAPLFAAPPEGKRYAVLVGVKKYDHKKLDVLEYTENDVTELAELIKPAGYEVVLLTDSTGAKDAALEPTKANIQTHLKSVLGRRRRDDLVLIALAGHGLQFDGKSESYFCPKDAAPLPDRTDTLISLESLYKLLDESGAGVGLLLVDACRSDPLGGRGRGIDGDSAKPPPKGIYAFFSCSAGERAFEHKDLKHGVFFHYVLEGLRGKAKDEDGDVSFEALALYVRKQVPRRAPELIQGARQTPSLRVLEASGSSPVVLAARAPSAGNAKIDGKGTAPDAAVTRAVSEEEMAKVVAELNRLEDTSGVTVGYLKRVGEQNYLQWRQAADQSSATGQYLTGLCLQLGVGVKKDLMEANAWIRKAAVQGLSDAEIVWGRILLYGSNGVTKDEAEALRLFRKNADRGHRRAMVALADCQRFGQGIPQDEAEAIRTLTNLSEQGYGPATFILGLHFQYTPGYEKNDGRVADWFRKAIDQGHVYSHVALGDLYLNGGKGLEKNEKEAFRLYRSAATAGEVNAMVKLAECYEDGQGVAEDVNEATEWYRKAATFGTDRAETRLKEIKTMLELRQDVNRDWEKELADDIKLLKRYHMESESDFDKADKLRKELDELSEKRRALWEVAASAGSRSAVALMCWSLRYGQPSLRKERLEQKARESGNAVALFEVAESIGGRDETKELALHRLAAEKGYAPSQAKIGLIFGAAGKSDEAAQWYAKAAQQDHPYAQYQLGIYYLIKNNNEEARKWLQRAAANGYAEANKSLENLM
jgi:TPR repeat protein/uncharacterized caspase-like protein